MDLFYAKKLGSITKAIEPLKSRIRCGRYLHVGVLYTLVRKFSWPQMHLIVAKGARSGVFVVRPMVDRVFSNQCGHFSVAIGKWRGRRARGPSYSILCSQKARTIHRSSRWDSKIPQTGGIPKYRQLVLLDCSATWLNKASSSTLFG